MDTNTQKVSPEMSDLLKTGMVLSQTISKLFSLRLYFEPNYDENFITPKTISAKHMEILVGVVEEIRQNKLLFKKAENVFSDRLNNYSPSNFPYDILWKSAIENIASILETVNELTITKLRSKVFFGFNDFNCDFFASILRKEKEATNETIDKIRIIYRNLEELDMMISGMLFDKGIAFFGTSDNTCTLPTISEKSEVLLKKLSFENIATKTPLFN